MKKKQKYKYIDLYRPVKREYVDNYRKSCIAKAEELLDLQACTRLVYGVLAIQKHRPPQFKRSRSVETLEVASRETLKKTGDAKQQGKDSYVLYQNSGKTTVFQVD